MFSAASGSPCFFFFEIINMCVQTHRRLFTVAPLTALEKKSMQSEARSKSASVPRKASGGKKSTSAAVKVSAEAPPLVASSPPYVYTRPLYDGRTLPHAWTVNRTSPERPDYTSAHTLIPGAREGHNVDNSHFIKGNSNCIIDIHSCGTLAVSTTNAASYYIPVQH